MTRPHRDTKPKGRPRIELDVWTRIVQKRASDPQHPHSIDRIRVELEREFSAGRLNRAPSRGTVANVVRWWEDQPPSIRERDLPFQWHELEKARLPWEASSWILECKFLYEASKVSLCWGIEAGEYQTLGIGPECAQQVLGEVPPFTNRLATWCWRGHQAVPQMPMGSVQFLIAPKYAFEEQVHDFFPELSEAEALWPWDDWLTFRPDLDENQQSRIPGAKRVYEEAIRLGIAMPLPGLEEEIRRYLGLRTRVGLKQLHLIQNAPEWKMSWRFLLLASAQYAEEATPNRCMEVQNETRQSSAT